MMSEDEFLAGLTGHPSDFRLAVEALRSTGECFCLIGGLAVNHYVEPVVTLDADFAVAGDTGLAEALKKRGFQVEAHAHSINATMPGSRLRLQITINSRYRDFPSRAVAAHLFGVDLPVAGLEDLAQGKVWAAQDSTRRASKRAKDRADLIRICESHARIIPRIPAGLVPEIDAMRASA
ncbi:MAG: hypothetical protein HY360_12385 [Verrucomicrobia bacterium]|nr:hypothetical protein [Verrucomicrobiota bacterium]